MEATDHAELNDHRVTVHTPARGFRTGVAVRYATPLPMVASWTDLTLEQSRIIASFQDLGVTIHVNASLGPGRALTDILTRNVTDITSERLLFVGVRTPEQTLWHARNLNGTGLCNNCMLMTIIHGVHVIK